MEFLPILTVFVLVIGSHFPVQAVQAADPRRQSRMPAPIPPAPGSDVDYSYSDFELGDFGSLDSNEYEEEFTTMQESDVLAVANGTELTTLQESEEFAIQHIESGLWVQPDNNNDNAPLVLWTTFSDSCRFKVIQRPDTLLIHIKHSSSDKYLYPRGRSSNPTRGTPIVIYPGHAFSNLFTFDQFNDIIKHQNGRIFIPDTLDNKPGTYIRLYDPADSVKGQQHFRVVSYTDRNKEFLVYGNAKVTAYWRLVFSLCSPAEVTQTFTETVQVGYAKQESSQTTNTFAWEISARAQYWFAEMSISLGLQHEVQASSSETWTTTTAQTLEIPVEKGDTVAVWQRFFEASQLNHRSVQQSNQYYQTKNCSAGPPEDDEALEKSYWI